MKVEPITPSERKHCAYCGKRLQPNYSCRKTFYASTTEAAGRTPEQQLAEYQSNRRIVRVARRYHTRHNYADDRPLGREVSSIEVVHFPGPADWGLWGEFCGQLCAARFGFSARRAGWKVR